MKLPFSLFLALRYLQPKRTFVSIITLISVLGVTLGITVLIVVIAVMTGFGEELRRKVLGFDAHMLVTNDQVIHDWREVKERIDETPGVVASAPFVQGPVIVEFEGRRMTPKIRGIDPEQEMRVTDIRGAIKEGALDLEGDKAVIGQIMANQLGIGVGDKLVVYSPANIGKILEELDKMEKESGDKKSVSELREMVLPQELTVSGIFQTGRNDYDLEFLLVPLHVGQELYELGDGLHGLTIRTTDPNRVGELQDRLVTELPPPLQVLTWIDLNKPIFDAIQMERDVMFIILMFLIVIASFCVMNTLITVTVQKKREIGILKALGATASQIVWVFLAQGMVVGFFGNITGLALGMTLLHYRNEFKDWLSNVLHREIFAPGIYQFSKIPAELVTSDVVTICVSAFVICSVAALIPAWFAARLDPVKALRYE